MFISKKRHEAIVAGLDGRLRCADESADEWRKAAGDRQEKVNQLRRDVKEQIEIAEYFRVRAEELSSELATLRAEKAKRLAPLAAANEARSAAAKAKREGV